MGCSTFDKKLKAHKARQKLETLKKMKARKKQGQDKKARRQVRHVSTQGVQGSNTRGGRNLGHS